MIVLPKEKTEAKVCNPKFAVFYGKPKAGKSCLMAALENNLSTWKTVTRLYLL